MSSEKKGTVTYLKEGLLMCSVTYLKEGLLMCSVTYLKEGLLMCSVQYCVTKGTKFRIGRELVREKPSSDYFHPFRCM